MPADMQLVESSNIDSIGYDDDLEELHVQFKSNLRDVYVYFNVPKSEYFDFLTSTSKGRYFNKYIKPTYTVWEKRPEV